MPRNPSEDDPEGTDSMSKRELNKRLNDATRVALGYGPDKNVPNKDPEGTLPDLPDDPEAVN